MPDALLDAESLLCQVQADARWLECRLASRGDQHGAAVARRLARDAVRAKAKLVRELERAGELVEA